MNTGQYGLGVLLLAVMVGSLAITACLVRRMLLPSWSQARQHHQAGRVRRGRVRRLGHQPHGAR